MIHRHPIRYDAARPGTRRLAAAALATSLLFGLVATGCGGSESDDRSAAKESTRTTAPSASVLADAGFVSTAGVQIDRSDSQTGQDTLVRFVLTGKAEDIEAALDAAKWKKPFESGNGVSQQPLPGSGVEQWKKVESSADEIKVDGKTLYRRVVRGAQDGLTKLHVWAFTT